MAFVGVTTSLATGGKGPDRVQLGAAYIESIQSAGGIPVLLAPWHAGAALHELLANMDGLVLTGGGDVDPGLYNESVHPLAGGISPRRDAFEMELVRWALGARKPVLAICRGMQILNVALGGSLHQHIPDVYGDSITHQQEAAGYPREEPTHAVEVRGGSLLANLVGAGSIGVNSMHHQAVRGPGSHVVITGRAPDGVVEALEAPALGAFVLGIQWHPEAMGGTSATSRALFEGFIAACAPAAPQALTA
jgi:putative glutamine amidotransferase